MRVSEEPDADGDLMFGPLDQEESSMAAAMTKRTAESVVSRASRRHGIDGDGAEGKSAKSSPLPATTRHQQQRRRRKEDKRERFYPVLNKQESPSSVRIVAGTGARCKFYLQLSLLLSLFLFVPVVCV